MLLFVIGHVFCKAGAVLEGDDGSSSGIATFPSVSNWPLLKFSEKFECSCEGQSAMAELLTIGFSKI